MTNRAGDVTMYKDTIDAMNTQAVDKAGMYNESKMKYIVASILAWAYIGIALLHSSVETV